MKKSRNEQRETFKDLEREQRLREQYDPRGNRVSEARRLEAGFSMLSGEGIYDDDQAE